MLRYHKQVFFDPKDTESLKAFTNRLNGLHWRYSSHSIEGLKYRAIDLESLLLFVKDIKLNDILSIHRKVRVKAFKNVQLVKIEGLK